MTFNFWNNLLERWDNWLEPPLTKEEDLAVLDAKITIGGLELSKRESIITFCRLIREDRLPEMDREIMGDKIY